MATVSELIKTPEWWFTVGVAGLFFSVIAAFLKDWISAGLARVFRAYRGYYARSKEREEKEIRRFVENPILLATRYLQLVFMVVLYVACVLLAFISPAWGFLVHTFPEVDILHPDPEKVYALSRWVAVVFLLLATALEFRIIIGLHLCNQAWKKLRDGA